MKLAELSASGVFFETAYALYEQVSTDRDDEEALTQALCAFVAAGDVLTADLAEEIVREPDPPRAEIRQWFRSETWHHRRRTTS
jgi:hypothetical protein